MEYAVCYEGEKTATLCKDKEEAMILAKAMLIDSQDKNIILMRLSTAFKYKLDLSYVGDDE